MAMASLSASLLARKGRAAPATDHTPSATLTALFAPRPAPANQARAKAAQKQQAAASGETPGARTGKTLRLDAHANRQLRLLAAHKGVSQQSLMEKALLHLLETELKDLSCVCGAQKPACRCQD